MILIFTISIELRLIAPMSAHGVSRYLAVAVETLYTLKYISKEHTFTNSVFIQSDIFLDLGPQYEAVA